jgi:hypothetical protein
LSYCKFLHHIELVKKSQQWHKSQWVLVFVLLMLILKGNSSRLGKDLLVLVNLIRYSNIQECN